MNLSFEQWMEVLRWLVPAGAAWAAFALSLYTWKQSRPRRRVSVFPKTSLNLVNAAIMGGLRPCIFISFINEQGPDVVLQEIGFECADGDRILYPDVDDSLPAKVSSGHSVVYAFDIVNLRSRVKGRVQEGKPIPAWAYCRDATGYYHKSKQLSHEIRSALIG